MKSSKKAAPTENLASITTYQAGVAQSTAYRLLKKFTEEAISVHGITTMQWFIIGTIYDAGAQGITVTELSQAVDTNLPYITNTLNLLEVKGIIVRTVRGKDTRSKLITVGPKFIGKVQAIENDLREKMRDTIYVDISPKELLIYVRVLYKLNMSLQEHTTRKS